VGGAQSCALLASGGVRCWGGERSGTAIGPLSPPDHDVFSGATAIATAGDYVCALTSNGGVRCWGYNDWGQLGNGVTSTHTVAPPDADIVTGVQAISTGERSVCALMVNGGVRCWGSNGFGQLGDGTLQDHLAPPASDAFDGVQAIATASNYACALMSGGEIRCWGYDSTGKLGMNVAERMIPESADFLSGIQTVASGAEHNCALTTSGGVKCWGDNSSGQLGEGSTKFRAVPSIVDWSCDQ
jgi:alpha-tubulin suppressor-like RCC1 family protein